MGDRVVTPAVLAMKACRRQLYSCWTAYGSCQACLTMAEAARSDRQQMALMNICRSLSATLHSCLK